MIPAAKQGDKVLAVDIHIVMVPSPAGPIPTPLPHPFTGTLDTKLSTDVKIEGQPAAIVGSQATNQPSHIATPPGTTFQKPPMNKGEVFMGSATVFINGKPAARTGDICKTCNDPTDLPIGSIISTTATVLIGGPPSMAGQAAKGSEAQGSGQGGGAQQATAEHEVTEAKDKVEFEILDAKGNPVKDAEYELLLPDGTKKEGKTGGDGTVKEEEVPVGTAQLRLKGLHNPRFEPSVAVVDEDIELAVDVAVLPNGTSVKFEIYREFEEADGDAIESLSASSKDGVARAKWKYSYDEKDLGRRPRFVFHAIYADQREVSDPLFVGDHLEIELKDTDGKPVVNQEFLVIAADGQEITGTSAEKGKIDLRGIAFGECLLDVGKGLKIVETS